MSLFTKLYTIVAIFVIAFLVYFFCYPQTEDNGNEKPHMEQHARPVTMTDKTLGCVVGLCVMWLVISYACKEVKNEAKQEKLNEQKEALVMSLSQKDKTIEQLRTKISENDKAGKKTFDHAEMLKVTESPAFRHFAEIADKPLIHPSSEDWQQLITLVDCRLPSFRSLLLNDNALSPKEYRVCILVLFAFKPGQMVNLTGYSSSDISKMRQRMLLKLFGEQGSAANFDRRLRGMIV